MPARTGTDGRAGRLRAVQATASASTSRATRNFISRPTPASDRFSIVPVVRGHRAWCAPLGGNPRPQEPRRDHLLLLVGALLEARGRGLSGASPPRMWFKDSSDQ